MHLEFARPFLEHEKFLELTLTAQAAAVELIRRASEDGVCVWPGDVNSVPINCSARAWRRAVAEVREAFPWLIAEHWRGGLRLDVNQLNGDYRPSQAVVGHEAQPPDATHPTLRPPQAVVADTPARSTPESESESSDPDPLAVDLIASHKQRMGPDYWPRDSSPAEELARARLIIDRYGNDRAHRLDRWVAARKVWNQTHSISMIEKWADEWHKRHEPDGDPARENRRRRRDVEILATPPPPPPPPTISNAEALAIAATAEAESIPSSDVDLAADAELDQAKHLLQAKLYPQSHATWMLPLRGIGRDDAGAIVIAAPNSFALAWIAEHYLSDLTRALGHTPVLTTAEVTT